ncbi:MAG: DUF349 domain-containing protein [Victivallaceae bacterium]|nr:DUF349 domain-containing protein [Victivallaceae bacterium]
MDEATLQRLEQFCTELEELTKSGDPEEHKQRRSELEKEFADAVSEIAAQDPEAKDELEKFRKKFARIDKTFSSALFQLYQTRDLERWEHYALKLKICEEIEVLNSLPDDKLPGVLPRLKQLRERWSQLGAVPHEKSEELWERFRKSSNSLSRRLDNCFAEIDASRAKVDEAKQALLEEAKTLCENPNYAAATPQLKALQQKWKELGAGHMKHDREAFAQFRALCDKFFADRNAFFSERKNAFSGAVEQKKQLVESAAKLAGLPPDELRRAAQQLYREWRNIPYAGRDDQKLYERFKAAIDAHFAAAHAADETKLKEREACFVEFVSLRDKLESGELDPAAANDLYILLRRKYEATGQLYGDAAAKSDRRWRGECAKLEKLLGEIRLKSFFDGSVARRDAEKALAAALEADDPGDVQVLLDALSSVAGQGVADKAAKLVERNADARRQAIEEFGSRRRALVDDMSRRLGAEVEGGLENNVQMLAMALENAIRGNFAGEEERFTPEHANDFEREFLALPLAPSAGADELFEAFEHTLRRLVDKISR